MKQQNINFTRELLIPLLELNKVKKSFENKSESPEFKKFEYLKKIHSLRATIDDGIENIKKINAFILIEKIPEYYLDNGISARDYYRHHVEYFHIQCISIIDYTMHLINHTLNLGISDRKCSYYSILENKNVKKTSLAQKMTNFHKEFEKIKASRNKIIHNGNFESDSLTAIDSTIIDSEVTKKADIDLDFLKYLEKERKKIIKNTINEFDNIIKKMESHLDILFNEMIPIFKFQLSVYELNRR